MTLSKELLDHIADLEKIKNWEKLPKDDPRITKLQELAKSSGAKSPEPRNGKKVVVFRGGKFVQAYNSAAEAAEELGMKPNAITAMARGVRRPPEGYRIEYIESEVVG